MKWFYFVFRVSLTYCTYSSTLLKSKHIEIKETIQIHWDANEWSGIQYSTIWRELPNARQENVSFIVLLELALNLLCKPVPTKRRRRTTLALSTVYFHLIRLFLSRTLLEKKTRNFWCNWQACRVRVTDNRLWVYDFQYKCFFFKFMFIEGLWYFDGLRWLLYIVLTISFLIGRSCTVNFRNQACNATLSSCTAAVNNGNRICNCASD